MDVHQQSQVDDHRAAVLLGLPTAELPRLRVCLASVTWRIPTAASR